jgi:hypothetical protein
MVQQVFFKHSNIFGMWDCWISSIYFQQTGILIRTFRNHGENPEVSTTEPEGDSRAPNLCPRLVTDLTERQEICSLTDSANSLSTTQRKLNCSLCTIEQQQVIIDERFEQTILVSFISKYSQRKSHTEFPQKTES